MCTRAFKEEHKLPSSSSWRVEFCGKRIVLPLTRDRAWLDWDLAVSVLGHDLEVKQTCVLYQFILREVFCAPPVR